MDGWDRNPLRALPPASHKLLARLFSAVEEGLTIEVLPDEGKFISTTPAEADLPTPEVVQTLGGEVWPHGDKNEDGDGRRAGKHRGAQDASWQQWENFSDPWIDATSPAPTGVSVSGAFAGWKKPAKGLLAKKEGDARATLTQ